MAFPTPPNPSNPIPNNPFYYPDGNYIRGEYGPFIVGGGIFIDNVTGTISAGGSGPGGVNTILAGTGIHVSPNTGGVVTVTNTGALSLTAGVGIQVVNSGGNYTIINTAPASAPTGTVTSVDTGTGLTGGPITSSGTIALAPSGVGPATYVNPTITVDAYGRITHATPGGSAGSTILTTLPLRSSGLSPQTLSVDGASTAAPGVVQLNDTVTSTSTAQAPTARALKQAYDLAYSASVNANTAISTANLACSIANSACTTALNAESCAILALTNAATAQATANARIPCTAFTAKGAVLAGTGAGAFTSLGVGANGQVLTACSACVSGLAWTTPVGGGGTVTSVTAGTGLTGGTITNSGTISLNPACVIPPTIITNKGDLITGTAASTPTVLAAGTNGQVLAACSACAPGLTWVTPPTPPTNATPTVAGIVLGCTVSNNTSLGCNALLGNTSVGNTAVGVNALDASPSGDNNTAVGACALSANTTGVNNTAVGSLALSSTTTGNFNVGVGRDALIANTTGCCNTVIGYQAACNLTTGSFNVAIGTNVQVASGIGSCQLAIGFSATDNWITGTSTKAIKPGAGIIDSTNSCGTANMVLTSQGNAIQWKSVSSALAVPNYGSYISTVTQTVGTLSVGQPVTLTAVDQNNFTLVGGSQITAGVAGKYNIQISLQIISTGGGGGDVEVWFVKNGLAVSNSNTRYSVKNANEEEVAALNFVDTFAAGENIQVFWASNNSLMTLPALASTMGGPAIPSAIVTIVPVGA